MRRGKNILQTVWEGKKIPAHQVARKKDLADQKSPIPPARVKWSAPKNIKFPWGNYRSEA